MNRWTRTIGLMALALLAGTAASDPPATAPSVDGHGGMVAATLITIHVKNASAQSVYAEIFRQAKLPLRIDRSMVVQREHAPGVSIDVDREPFWEVMNRLAMTSGFNLEHEAGSVFWLVGRDEDWREWMVSGAVSILPMSVWYLHYTPLDGSVPNDGYFYVDLMLKYEPKLWVTSTATRLKVAEAVDDLGNSLVPDKAPAADEEFRYINFPYIRADLKYPAHHAGAKIARLRGTIAMTVATRIAHVEVPGILHAGPTAMTVNGETFRFIKCEPAGLGGQYQRAIEAPADHSAERRRLFADAASRMELQDVQGREFMLVSYGLNADPDKPTMTLMFSPYGGAGQPDRLVWNAAADVKHLEVPVELHDLRMDMGDK